MKYFDSHCHIDMEPLKNEQQAVIERAYKAGVTHLVNVGSSMRGSKASVELANQSPNIYASVGLHPHDAEAVMDLESTIEELEELSKNEKVVAIGEIGLDYFYLEKPELKKEQQKLFEAQLDLAERLGKPVIIHTRDAEEDTLEIIQKSKIETKNSSVAPGVVHCFTGTPEFAKKLVDLGFYIGFTGFITFDQEKFDHIRESVKVVPIEKIVIETDAPFLAPEPYRGKTNEPAYVVEVANKIAEIKGLSVEEVAQKTFDNAKKLFDLG